MTEEQQWAQAGRIAFFAMSKVPGRQRDSEVSDWAAERDPLAWWCLTEWIMDLVQEAA